MYKHSETERTGQCLAGLDITNIEQYFLDEFRVFIILSIHLNHSEPCQRSRKPIKTFEYYFWRGTSSRTLSLQTNSAHTADFSLSPLQALNDSVSPISSFNHRNLASPIQVSNPRQFLISNQLRPFSGTLFQSRPFLLFC